MQTQLQVKTSFYILVNTPGTLLGTPRDSVWADFGHFPPPKVISLTADRRESGAVYPQTFFEPTDTLTPTLTTYIHQLKQHAPRI